MTHPRSIRSSATCVALLLTLLLGACGPAALASASAVPTGGEPSAIASDAIEPTANLDLADFEARVRDATAREGALVRALATASTGSAADIRLVVAQMRRWVQGERDWLAAHPPDACYQAAADAFGTGIDGFETTADLSAAIAPAGPQASDDPAGAEAGAQLEAATTSLQQAAAVAKTARSACR